MARITKKGLNYFPLDVTFLSGRKMRRMLRKHGPVAATVIIAALATTYSEKGYYLEWNEDVCFDLTEQANTEYEKVQAIIVDAMHLEMFDTEMFKKHAVLTSEGIQKQYLECTLKRRNVVIKEEYRLTKADSYALQKPENGTLNPIKVPQNTLWGEETPFCGTEMQQRKEKQTESKQKEKQTTPLPPRRNEEEKGDGNSGTCGKEGRKEREDEEEKNEKQRREDGEERDGKEHKENTVLLEGRQVPRYCLNKRTHNCDGLIDRLAEIHVTEVKQVNQILRLSDYGRIGHPLWRIISHNNWPRSGIKFPGKFILSQLRDMDE